MQQELQAIIDWMQQGQFGLVVEHGRAFLTRYPQSAVARNLLGTALAKKGDLAEGIAELQSLVKEHPDYAFGHLNLGNFLAQDDRADEAIRHLQCALQLDPFEAEIHNSLSNAFHAADAPTEALAHARSAVELDPSSVSHSKRLALYLLRLGQHDEALRVLTKTLALAPKDPEALLASGKLFSWSGEYQKALSQFHKAARVQPYRGETYLAVGRLWFDAKEFGKAIEALELSVTFAPKDTTSMNLLAESHLHNGNKNKAAQTFRRSLAIDPENALAQHFLSAVTGATTRTAPSAYVRDLFDGYAEHFEKSLVTTLGYDGPTVILERLSYALPHKEKFSSVLDLGCGTGLLGEAMRERAETMAGVDLSENMVRIARAKSVYDRLVIGEIATVVRQDGPEHDLYVAADVLVYVGDLSELFDALKLHAAPNAVFAFTTEHGGDDGYELLETGRFRHSTSYINSICQERGMEILDTCLFDLRLEHGEMLTGGCYTVALSAK